MDKDKLIEMDKLAHFLGTQTCLSHAISAADVTRIAQALIGAGYVHNDTLKKENERLRYENSVARMSDTEKFYMIEHMEDISKSRMRFREAIALCQDCGACNKSRGGAIKCLIRNALKEG